jgi:hypothetical protein
LIKRNSSSISPQRTRGVVSDLSPAHKGYHYQDQAAALFFLRSLFESFEEITVDKKEVDDDRFDDLSVRQDSRHTRRQFKSSDDRSRVFRPADLWSQRHNIRIDDLVRTHQRFGANAPTEYRLCATWLTPTDTRLLDVIEPMTADPSFPGHPTKMFRLRSGVIWPSNGPSKWRALRNAQDLDRQTFVDFADRFIIELECPPSSRDFSKPDALESLVLSLLTESVGIGRYPNQNRSAVDVAGGLQQYAYRARTERRTVRPFDVEREVGLNKNFGRVEQEFPILQSAVVKRAFLRDEVREQLDSQFIVVQGPPGSGKSWELTGLASDLSAEGYVVARHYCYLEPGDPQVQRRITTNAMFGNLIYDLIKDHPGLEKLHRPAYSAGRRELEDLLKKGVEKGVIDKAVLVIDGVDHISRVFADSTGVAQSEIDIVEELASLDLPHGVSLVIGSQPGDHLDALRSRAQFVDMPVWRFDEVAGLARRLGLPMQLRRVGLSRDIVRQFLGELHHRSDGNPLYATFLCRFTLEQIAKGATLDVVSGLRDAPLTGGDISVYYQYLLRTAVGSGATEPLAELLGLIDFGVTQQELKEIIPSWAHHIEAAISNLKPVLDPNPSHRGIRIYHESFRRFIKEWLVSKNASVADVLSQVIDWLKRRDFFDDPRTYRFLLPTLRRASRSRELLEQVGVDFVSRSVEAGHARKAVEQNLSLATYTAAEELAWTHLARCVELQKSCKVCFDDKLTDYDVYGRTFAAVHGAEKLAERMVFDGQPAFTIRQGLMFCSLCDDAGVVAPWPQYLWHSENETDDRPSEDKDWVTDALAEFHGLVRLEGVEALSRRIVAWLRRINKPEPRYFRGMLKRLKQFGGRRVLESLLSEATMSAEVEALVLLELAHAVRAEGELGEAASYATAVVKKTGNTGVAVECLLMGADRAEIAKRCPSLENFGAGNDERYDPNAAALRIWVEGVRIAAAVDPARLGKLEAQVPGEGWYSNWLRFVMELARAEERALTNEEAAEASIVAAFTLLASDTERFKGDPRPCDLYSQRKIIHETIARALRLIRDRTNFELVLSQLADISSGTTSYLNNSPGGPLIPENLIEVLMPYVVLDDFRAATIAEMQRQLEKIRQGGELYDTLATADLFLAQALAMAGEKEAAQALWQSSAVHVCAYGYRRDLSILDLTESAPALAQLDSARASELMAAAQPLVNAVDAHTDGKETQYTPIYWAGSLAKVHPAAAASVVGSSVMRNGGVVDWRHENAIGGIADALRDNVEPSLVALLDATLPKAGHGKAIVAKLATIQRVISEDRELGVSLLRTLAAKARGGDSEQLLDRALALENGLPASASPSIKEESYSANERATSSTFFLDRFLWANYGPMFSVEATPFDLSITIRSRRHSKRANDPHDRQLLNALGYRLVEMIDRGQESEALNLLASLARETYFWESATLLAEIGEGLERHGKRGAAAIAYTLAYAHSRGDRGYLLLGDEEQLPWFLKACELSEDAAWRALANEIAYLLHDQTYGRGITRHLVELLAARPETEEIAFAAWEATYGVLNHRLPRNEADYYVFEKHDPSLVPSWSVDEALVFLLLARMCHPDLGRKTSALAGLLWIVGSKPTIVGKPLRHFLASNSPISSVLLVLKALLLAEPSPYIITEAIQDHLRALYRSGIFGFRVMAQQLIERAQLNLGELRRAQVLTENSLPTRRREAILSLDWGNRTGTIARIWNDFPGIVAGRFNEEWESSKALRDRSRQRHEAARSRGYDNLPAKQFLHWEVETFESVFHEVLEGIDDELWREGEWDANALAWIVSNILPGLPLHVRRWFSRDKRPNLPMPSEVAASVTQAAPTSSSDEFDGWYRCGYYEREIVLQSMVHVVDDVSVMSGLHAHVEKDALDEFLTPFAMGNSEVWLEGVGPGQSRDVKINQTLPEAVTGVEFVRDWLGEFPILMIQPYLQARCGLSPSDALRLELVDENGKVGAVFRRWEDRIIGESVGEEVPRIQGCELLLRPDLFARISRYFDQPLVTITQPLRSSRSSSRKSKPPARSTAETGEGSTGEGSDAQDRSIPQPSGAESIAVT